MSQYEFGNWRFNADVGELCDGENTTRLEPQVGKLLAYFLDNQNTLASRDQIINAVWEGRIVSDDAINRCVSILRQILTPEDKNAFIETVVRRGFISHFPAAPESVLETGSKSQIESLPGLQELPEQLPRRSRLRTVLELGLLAVLIIYFIANRDTDNPQRQRQAETGGIPVLAVLPFSTSDHDGDSEFFANGIHDDLLTQLAQLQSMRVISRTSVMGYQGRNLNILDIGKELGADAILEGGIQRNGDQIRINAQLIDARTDEHLWAGQYDRELLLGDLFEIQSEIAVSIAKALQTTLTEQDSNHLSLLPTQNMAAFRAYHQSMVLRDTGSLNEPAYLDALERAVALDPGYVRAWAELAGYLSYKNLSQPNDASIIRIEEILVHIRDIAPQSAEYVIAQAYYNYYIIKNYEQALLLTEHAHELRPSDPRILELKGFIQRRLGDYEGRLESIRQAGALDPKNPFWTISLILNLMVAHQYDEASREINKASFQSFDLAMLDGWLQIRADKDLAQWGEILTAIEREYDQAVSNGERLNAYIWSRDFEGADTWLDLQVEEFDSGYFYGWFDAGISAVELQRLVIYWFLQDHDRLDPLTTQLLSRLDEMRNGEGGFDDSNDYLAWAFLTAVAGDTQETERAVRNWRRMTTQDFAEYTMQKHFSCRALGMSAAVAAAVKCIRESLHEPSVAMPFVEPFLPYYDPIRDSKEFVELVKEFDE